MNRGAGLLRCKAIYVSCKVATIIRLSDTATVENTGYSEIIFLFYDSCCLVDSVQITIGSSDVDTPCDATGLVSTPACGVLE